MVTLLNEGLTASHSLNLTGPATGITQVCSSDSNHMSSHALPRYQGCHSSGAGGAVTASLLGVVPGANPASPGRAPRRVAATPPARSGFRG